MRLIRNIFAVPFLTVALILTIIIVLPTVIVALGVIALADSFVKLGEAIAGEES